MTSFLICEKPNFAIKKQSSMSKKDRGGFVYSTNPDFGKEEEGNGLFDNLKQEKQNLIVQKSTKHRAGKVATLIIGFKGKDEELEALAKMLKNKCGVGGSTKDGEIIIQGDVKQKVADILTKEGYKVKLGN